MISPIHLRSGMKRGDLRMFLTSPRGTRSTLLHTRPHDTASSGFTNWPFMSTHTWGEDPHGEWTLEIHNDAKPRTWRDGEEFRAAYAYGLF